MQLTETRDIVILIMGILGAILSPIASTAGLLWQYRRDKHKLLLETKEQEIKEKQQAVDIDLKLKHSDMETITFYISMVKSLQEEVRNLTSRIDDMSVRLKRAESEKESAMKDNAVLLDKVNAYEEEVQCLRKEVTLMREERKTKHKKGEQ